MFAPIVLKAAYRYSRVLAALDLTRNAANTSDTSPR